MSASTIGRLALLTALTTATSNLCYAQEAAAERSHQLDEIVVTAQRRSENLQNVPIAISAVTGDTLSAAGVQDIAELPQLVPGLMIPDRGGAPTPTLRGVGALAGTYGGADSPIAVYVDGVLQAGFIAPTFSFNNIERVEVLKGPQGTLFGRNATGGVIQIVTRQPSEQASVDLSFGYGNFDTKTASFYGTTGIGPDLATDLSVYFRDQAKGWGRNLATGDEFSKAQQLAIRNKWRAQIGEDTDATIALVYNRQESSIGRAGALPGAIMPDGSTFAGYYNVNLNLPENPGTIDQKAVSLTINHDMDWARLVSISAWQKYLLDQTIDLDFSPSLGTSAEVRQPETTWSQELQLQSPSGNPISWVLGVYYINDRTDLSQVLTGSQFFGLAYLDSQARLRTSSYAGFAQATVPLFTNTNLTAGLRYTHERRRITATTVVGVPIPFVGVAAIENCAPQPACPFDRRVSFDKLTYKAALDHKFTPDLMAYAQYSRGFKSGNFVITSPASPVIEPEVLDSYEIGFKSEWFDRRVRVNASSFYYRYRNMQVATFDAAGNPIQTNADKAEVKGADLDLEIAATSDLTLRAGVSYLDAKFTSFPDAQIFTPNLGQCAFIPPFFSLPGQGNCTDFGDASGNKLPFSPKWSVSLGARYVVRAAFGEIALSANYFYTARQLGLDYSDRLHVPSYSLTNAAISWTSPDSRWTARLWADNLFDKKYIALANAASGDIGAPGAPRTFGVTIGMHWGENE